MRAVVNWRSRSVAKSAYTGRDDVVLASLRPKKGFILYRGTPLPRSLTVQKIGSINGVAV